MPSGFSDTAFASRVSPRALRALRPAGFPHRRSITESERDWRAWGLGGVGDWEGVSDGGDGLNLNKTPFKRLGYTDKNFEIFTQNEHLPAQRFFF